MKQRGQTKHKNVEIKLGPRFSRSFIETIDKYMGDPLKPLIKRRLIDEYRIAIQYNETRLKPIGLTDSISIGNGIRGFI